MSERSSIEWTETTWNPTTGCDRVSAGCEHCYALTLARRLKAMGSAHYQYDGDPATSGPGFGVAMHQDALMIPLRWRAPRTVFVNSMSDLFHKDIPDEYIARIFAVMARTPQHTYQILTKRHARMRSLLGNDGQPLLEATRDQDTAQALYAAWPLPNVHLGVSVENQRWAETRIPALMHTPAAVRFLSCEPLLGPIDLRAAMWTLGEERGHGLSASYVHAGGCCERLHGLDWVIAGAESGPGARPMNVDWVRALRDQCVEAGTAFFYKQDANKGKKIPTPELDGRTWTQMPDRHTDGAWRPGPPPADDRLPASSARS